MKLHKTAPEETTQWQADAPGIKAMRVIMPIAAILSATSLAGGIASFFKVGLTTTAGICLIVAFAVAAWFFDSMAVSAGQSVVRESILGWKKKIERDLLFWINLVFATLICGAMVFGSVVMSRSGISYLVLEVRKAKEISTQADTTLNQTIAGATDQNAGILEAKKTAYEAQVNATQTTYAGKVEALEAEIGRREKQRTPDNTHYIDNRIQKLKKQIGEVRAEEGEKLSALATEFAAEQDRILSGNEDLQSVVIADAKAASERAKIQQAEKDAADLALSGLVSSIFAWSVVLMLIIGLRLSMLETRNGILPNPVLTNADLSGPTMLLRFVLAVPNFILSCLTWCSEWLYKVAPKHRTPVVDDDLIDFKTDQAKVIAIRKQSKHEKSEPTERRKIGYSPPGIAAETDGEGLAHARARVTESVMSKTESAEVPTGSCLNCGSGFVKTVPHKKYCSDNCRLEYHAAKHGGEPFDITKQRKKK